MKNVFLIALLLLSSCAYLEDGACVGECEQSGIGQKGDKDLALGRKSVYSVDDEFIGYAIGYTFGYITVHIPAYNAYVSIQPKTGEYQERPASQHEEIYFDDEDCSGDAVVMNWDGKVGTTYIRAKNQRTYLITSTTYYSETNTFSAKSKLVANRPAHDSCHNENYLVKSFAANLREEDAMPDLSPYAPFQLFEAE